MLQIEGALHAVHAEALEEKQKREAERKEEQELAGAAASIGSSSAGANTITDEAALERSLPPFARVNAVAPDSPAREAVCINDEVTSSTLAEMTNVDTQELLGAFYLMRLLCFFRGSFKATGL